MTDSYKIDESTQWKQRIVGHGMVSPDDLLANPLNFRIHSKLQQDTIAGLLDEIGWVKSVQVNQTTGHILDGHARVTIALRTGQPVPVEYVDLTEDEEALALASLDYIVGMAATDKQKLDALLKEVQTGDEALMGMLSTLAADEGVIPPDFEPVPFDEQPRLDQKNPVYCPHCGREYS